MAPGKGVFLKPSFLDLPKLESVLYLLPLASPLIHTVGGKSIPIPFSNLGHLIRTDIVGLSKQALHLQASSICTEDRK